MNEKSLDRSASGRAPAEQEEQGESWGSFLAFLAKLALAVVLFRSLVFSPFSIPSESMLPQLWKGDYLLASKWSYGYSRYSFPFSLPLIPGRVLARTPERGDIVIFKHPLDGTDYVKRVIALPGDTIGLRDGVVILNGQPLPRERIEDFVIPVSANTDCAWGAVRTRDDSGKMACRYARFRETLPSGKSYDVLDFGLTEADNRAPVTVPRGRIFVMGDNRDNSQDSRFPAMAGAGVGLVPQEKLVGRAAIILWSSDGSANWFAPWTWFTAARWDRMLTRL